MRQLVRAGLCALAATACVGDDDGERAETEPAVVAETAAMVAELLAPIRAMSVVMVEFGNVGVSQSALEDVRRYAATLAADHHAVVQALDSTASVRGASIQETTEAAELANSARMAHSGLGSLQGSDFDLTFIRAQVESHRQFLDRIELDLVPAARSPEMQMLLSDVRALEVAHLTRARQILATLLGQTTEPAGSPQRETPTAPPQGRPPVPPPPPQDTAVG